MQKRFLLPFLCLLLVSGVLFGPASADYLNDSWLRERSGEFLTGEDRAVPAGPQFLTMRKHLLPDSVQADSGAITIGVRPPVNIATPYLAKTDSMDSENRAVIRRYEVPGLRVERYQVIPIEEYAATRLVTNLLRTWRSNEKRIPNWASSEKSGAANATDLDFALPVGKRFEHLVGGKSRLDINGSQTITFSGKSEYDEGAIATSATSNSAFPSLSMKQEPQFSIRGSIGDRITVDIKQESSSGFSFGSNLEDNISIKYKGEDTDIIQNIEAGNTSLNLEGAQFAGYSGSHKGLFGIRTEGRVGPLKFTAIASQEKSESGKKTFKGTSEESTKQIHDYDYKRNTYFFLDYIYRTNFDTAASLDMITFTPTDSIATFLVYEDDGNINNDMEEGTIAYPGTAYPMNLNGEIEGANTEGVNGKFHQMDQTAYSVNRSLGYIIFKNPVPLTSTIGVYMVLNDKREIGSLDYKADESGSRMKFKLIKQKSQTASNSDTWNLEWKNVYDLGQTDIKKDGLEVNIYRDTSDGVKPNTQDGAPIIRILGLDNRDQNNDNIPDNKIDLYRSLVDYSRGELIFPRLRPFASDHTPAGVDIELNPKVPDIYDKSTSKELENASKYYIEVKTASGKKTLKIDAMSGITEGTERVTVSGRTLTRGSDYTISYTTGEITFLKTVGPTEPIEVAYEEQSAIMSMRKSLFGLRTEYDFWSNSHIGGVFLYNNENTTEERVKLGSEPSRTILFDTDASLNFDAPVLTKTVDALPFVIADQKSTVRFEGELARSLPNMNTKGEVYVDDFEGSQNTMLSTTRTNWTMGSAPDSTITNGMWMTKRGTLRWYNPEDHVNSKDIWKNKDTTTEDNTVSVFNLSYRQAEGTTDPRTSFGAIMMPFSGGGQDFSQARFIELWVKGTKGALKIDLGSLSEDWYPLDDPDGEINTEDRPLPGTKQGNGILNDDEDTGFDGLFDKDEPGYNSISNTDPSADNWAKERDNYAHVNGLEGNSRESGNQTIDTEDINGNGNLDTATSYYEYSIDLGNLTDPYLVPGTKSDAGWRMFRVPLWNNDLASVGGTRPPDSTLIEFARLIVTGCDTTLIQIASMEIAENSWLEDRIVDSTGTDVLQSTDDEMRISRINTDDNSRKENGDWVRTGEYYYPPRGVKQQIDKATDVTEMEQSLVIITKNLAPGNTAFAYRSFSTKMDFTNYTALKMYVHGSEAFPLVSQGSSTAELVFRFGADRENYYEYRTPIYYEPNDWAEENNIEADFATCTGLKLARSEVDSTTGRYEKVVGTKIYAVYGSPNLQNIKLISIGIRNKGVNNLNSEVWLDELRMDNLRDMTGTAARASIDANLADFANVAARIEHRTADFHGMNSSTGSGADATSWSTSVSMNLDRFAPKRWNLQLPVRGDMNESTSLPRLKSGSDIILTDAQKREYKSESSGQSYSISYRKNADPSQKGMTKQLLSWGLEKWNASYTWGENTGSTPLTGATTEHQSQGQFTYNVNPSGRSVSLFSWTGIKNPWIADRVNALKLGYTPTQLSYDLNYSDKFNLDDETAIGGVADTTETRTMSERINFGYDPLSNILKYQYTQSRNRDLVLERQTDYSETNRLTLTGPRFGYLSNNYNYDVSYREENNPRYAKISSELGGRDIALQKRFSADASLEWGRLFEKLGRDSGGKQASSEEPGPGGQRKAPPKGGMSKTKGAAKKQEPQKLRATSLRTKIFSVIAKTVSPLGFRYSKDEAFDYAAMRDRPGFGSRFGFGTIDPDTTTVVVLSNSQSNASSISLETNLDLPMNMGLSTSMDMSSQSSSSSSSSSRSEGATLPELNFSWNNIDSQMQFLKKYMTNISMTSGFSVQNSKAWADGSVDPTSDKTTRSHSPLISLNGIVYGGVQSSLSISMSSEENTTVSGTTANTTVADKLSMSSTFRYNLSPSNKFLQRIKVKSSVDLLLALEANQNETRQSTNGSQMAVTDRSSSWSVKPTAEYRFSQKFTGSAMIYVRNSKNLAGTIHKIREVSISGKMIF